MDIIELSIIGYQISNIMGKQSRKEVVYEEPPKKRGRQAGAKTYNKQTVFKLISQLKPTNMVLWGTVAEQYRIACGELEARQASVFKKFFIQKMCNSMRKPTGSSGIDDFTAKCQALNRSLYALEEGDTFGDSDDEDEVMENTQISNDDSSSDDDLDLQEASPLNTPTAAATDKSSSQVLSSDISLKSMKVSHHGDTKSKNAKPNPTSRLNVGK